MASARKPLISAAWWGRWSAMCTVRSLQLTNPNCIQRDWTGYSAMSAQHGWCLFWQNGPILIIIHMTIKASQARYARSPSPTLTHTFWSLWTWFYTTFACTWLAGNALEIHSCYRSYAIAAITRLLPLHLILHTYLILQVLSKPATAFCNPSMHLWLRVQKQAMSITKSQLRHQCHSELRLSTGPAHQGQHLCHWSLLCLSWRFFVCQVATWPVIY